jgi:hypothetical protein
MNRYIELLNKIKTDIQDISFVVQKDCIDINSIIDNICQSDEMREQLEPFKTSIILGYFQTSSYIKYRTYSEDIVYIYIIISVDCKYMYIMHDFTMPNLWYKINLKEIDDINLSNIILDTIIYYNNKTYPDINSPNIKNIRGIIGSKDTLNVTLNEIEQLIHINPFCENFIWGSYFSDFPYRDKVREITYSNLEMARILSYSLRQKLNNNGEPIKESISFYTKSSYSLLKIEEINDLYILDIYYLPYKYPHYYFYTDNIHRDIPKDIPLDVLGFLNDFTYITHNTILNLGNLTPDKLVICAELCNTEERYTEVLPKLLNIKENHPDENIRTITSNTIYAIDTYNKFSRIKSNIIEKIIEESKNEDKEIEKNTFINKITEVGKFDSSNNFVIDYLNYLYNSFFV